MIKPPAPIVMPDVRSSDETWSVEIVKLPEDLAYALGVERLKARLHDDARPSGQRSEAASRLSGEPAAPP
jgi:hypothetical protein